MLEQILYPIAGVDPNLMKQVSSKERSKYITIGGTILFTGTIAGLTCGFAVFTVVNSLPIAASIGTLWSSGIILLDKSFVSGIDKKKDNWQQQTFKAIPRLFLSCTLGIIIGQPVTVLIAKSAIQKEINRQEQQILIVTKQKQKDRYKEEIDDLKRRKNQLEPNWKDAQDKVSKLASSTCGEGQCIGANRAYDNAKKVAGHLDTEYQNLQTNLKTSEQRIQKIDDELKALEDDVDFQSLSKSNYDFFYQWQILNGLIRTNSNILKLDLFITALFILIEICPVLVKLMSEPGSYDQLIADEEDFIKHKSKEETEAKKQQINDEITSRTRIEFDLRNKTQSKISQVLAEQFENLIKQVSDINNPQVKDMLNQAFKIILNKMKKQYIYQAKQIQVSDAEIQEELESSKKQTIKQETQNKVEREVCEAQSQREKKEGLQSLEQLLQKSEESEEKANELISQSIVPDLSNSTVNQTSEGEKNNHASNSNRNQHYFASNFIPFQSKEENTHASLNGKNSQ